MSANPLNISLHFSRKSGLYRYSFNGKESESTSVQGAYDFGARILDARLGRWLCIDKIHNSFYSLYSYSGNDPINLIDIGGNDEIHFNYWIVQEMDGEGRIHNCIVFDTQIIKDGKDDIKFFVGSALPGSTEIQFNPNEVGMRIANYHSFNASSKDAICSKETWLFNSLTADIDDYSYLGILLNASPEVVNEYQGTAWESFMKGAQAAESSRQVASELRSAVETVYAIIDGFYLLKAAGKFAVKSIIKPRSFSQVLSDSRLIKTDKNVIYHNDGSASKTFNEIVESSGGKTTDVVDKGNGVKVFTSGDKSYTLRSSSGQDPTISVTTEGVKPQDKIRFMHE